jgi:tripartite-type tricarboxylate transporter receptor subunit TctC
LDALPGIPALTEFIPGYDASTWTGLGAPKNTAKEIIEKLNQAINAVLADRVLNEAKLGVENSEARSALLDPRPMPIHKRKLGLDASWRGRRSPWSE